MGRCRHGGTVTTAGRLGACNGLPPAVRAAVNPDRSLVFLGTEAVWELWRLTCIVPGRSRRSSGACVKHLVRVAEWQTR